MKRPCRDEEHMIGLDRAILRNNRRALYNRQDVALNPLTRDVCARTASITHGDLINLIEEDDAAVLGSAHCLLGDNIHIDEFVRLLGREDLARLCDCHLALVTVFRHEFPDHGLEVVAHPLQGGTGKHIAHRARGFLHLDFDDIIFELTGAQPLAHPLTSRLILRRLFLFLLRLILL